MLGNARIKTVSATYLMFPLPYSTIFSSPSLTPRAPHPILIFPLLSPIPGSLSKSLCPASPTFSSYISVACQFCLFFPLPPFLPMFPCLSPFCSSFQSPLLSNSSSDISVLPAPARWLPFSPGLLSPGLSTSVVASSHICQSKSPFPSSDSSPSFPTEPVLEYPPPKPSLLTQNSIHSFSPPLIPYLTRFLVPDLSHLGPVFVLSAFESNSFLLHTA